MKEMEPSHLKLKRLNFTSPSPPIGWIKVYNYYVLAEHEERDPPALVYADV